MRFRQCRSVQNCSFLFAVVFLFRQPYSSTMLNNLLLYRQTFLAFITRGNGFSRIHLEYCLGFCQKSKRYYMIWSINKISFSLNALHGFNRPSKNLFSFGFYIFAKIFGKSVKAFLWWYTITCIKLCSVCTGFGGCEGFSWGLTCKFRCGVPLYKSIIGVYLVPFETSFSCFGVRSVSVCNTSLFCV